MAIGPRAQDVALDGTRCRKLSGEGVQLAFTPLLGHHSAEGPLEEQQGTCGLAAEMHPHLERAAARLFKHFLEARFLGRELDEGAITWREEADPMGVVLERWHPNAMTGIGSPCGWWLPDPVNVLRFCTNELMRRALRAAPPGPNLSRLAMDVARELDEFLHAVKVEVRVVAELVGLHLPERDCAPIEFDTAPELSLERISEDLVTDFDLGPSSRSWELPRFEGACAITVRSATSLRFGPAPEIHNESVEDILSPAHDLLLALQVVHRNPIGTPRFIRRATSFMPMLGLNAAFAGESPSFTVPSDLVPEAIDRTRAIYRGLRSKPHASMRLACSRLGVSRLRMRPEDAILDAAIGLEAILLSGGGRGELRYQFSLNYALLEADPELRAERFARAQGVYDVRSVIAHGGHPSPQDIRKVAGSRTLTTVAARCQDMLAECIETFRSEMRAPKYTSPEYWRHHALGASEPRTPS